MIFTDKETASTLRHEAQQQIIDWAIDIAKQMRDYPEAMDESVENFVSSQFMGKFPPLANTLLFKSGIIFPDTSSGDETPHYPVTLFYDDDNVRHYKVATAIHQSDGLSGGMVEGRIHT